MANAYSKSRFGFTLLELLIGIAILAVLLALLIPAAPKLVERSKATKCVNNMRQLGFGLLAYAGEHNGRFPTMPDADDIAAKDTSKGWQGQIADYIGYNSNTGNPPVFACPSGIRNPKSIPLGHWRGYAMNEIVQDAFYQNHTIFGDGRQALLLEFWVADTHSMAGVIMLGGTSQINFGQKTRMAWRHNGAMNVLRKDGSVIQSGPGQTGTGADVNWWYRGDGTVWRDGQFRSQ